MKKHSKELNKNFYSKLLILGIPIAIQQFITSLINLLDSFMLGSVSEEVLTAAGLANKLFFVFIVVIFGATSGAAIFIAQFYGKKDLKSAQQYLGISIIIATIISIIFSLTAAVFPVPVMRIFSKSDEIIEYGAKYLRIVGFSYLPTAISVCLYTGLKSTRHAYIPLIFTLVALFINFTFNFLFIYIFDMGIEGAAYATLIARVVEFVALYLTISIRKTAVSTSLKKLFSFNKEQLKRYFKIAGFVIFIELEWSVGNALYVLAFKKYGTTYQAAVQVADTCIILFNVFAIALGNAGAVILGNSIGEGNSDTAVKYAKKLYFMSIIFGLFIGVAVILLAPALPLIFTKLTPDGKEYTRICLILMGAVMPVRCLEFMLMVGILRSGGDTKFGILCDTVGVWILTLPALLITAYIFNLPFHYVYFLLNIEMFFKCIVGSIRVFKNNNWLHNVTINKT